MDDIAARARELALFLTALPSVSGTTGEAELPQKLVDRISLFESWTVPVDGGSPARSNVFALKRGKSRKTVVLTGHFDTVPFDDYGDLAEFALSPEKLTHALIRKLRLSGENRMALADLEGGVFLPGRGLLDMKAGLAAGLAAMEAYRGELTVLFVGVADEEEKSAGARAAIGQIRHIALTNDLAISLIINLDSISDQGDGSAGRVVTYGSIGKQLVTAYVVGKQTHAGYPEDGANAAYIAAELIREFELAPELAERTGKELAAPPTALYAKDLKQGYNVTTPGRAFVYWNTMQHCRSGTDVLAISHDLAARAIARAEAKLGRRIALRNFAELAEVALPQDATLSLPDQTRAAMTSIVDRMGLTEPTVILGFGSIPYPAVQLRDTGLRKAISQAVRTHDLGEVNYFAGISDMSFFGEATGDLGTVAANTPIWNSGFTMPDPGGYSCINIGPWGRDYHHWLERLHAPYAFETLPRVVLSVINAVATM